MSSKSTGTSGPSPAQVLAEQTVRDVNNQRRIPAHRKAGAHPGGGHGFFVSGDTHAPIGSLPFVTITGGGYPGSKKR